MSRVAIFIDGGYVDKVLRHEFGGAKIAYARFSQEISAQIHPDIDILRTYYYHLMVRSFLRRFRRIGAEPGVDVEWEVEQCQDTQL